MYITYNRTVSIWINQTVHGRDTLQNCLNKQVSDKVDRAAVLGCNQVHNHGTCYKNNNGNRCGQLANYIKKFIM